MSSQKRTYLLLLLAASVCGLVLAAPAPAAAPAGDGPGTIVRRDWYFRESLAAIQDWEKLLAAWEGRTPKGRQAPVFPVPADGKPAAWPVPIGPALWPGRSGPPRVQVRLEGGRVRIDRQGEDGKVQVEQVAPGQAVTGCTHPGGGAKDQSYHNYRRRFDAMTVFRPVPAPLAIELDAPADFQRGPNVLAVRVRNASAKPLAVEARLSFLAPPDAAVSDCAKKSVQLAPAAAQTLRLPFDLTKPGGGMLVLAVQADGQTYWLPLLTCVEDVQAVLKSVEQVLADDPDPAGSAQLADLRRRTAAWTPAQPWRRLFEEASLLRDRLLRRRINFDTLLFLERQPFISEQPYMDAHHLFNRPGGGVYRLSPVRPDGQVTPVLEGLGEGVYRDLCLHWDARRLLLSFGNGSDTWDGRQSYHIYELDLTAPVAAAPAPAGPNGAPPTPPPNPRQLTFGPKNDCEPIYLPDGRIAFTSDRGEHFVMCGGDRHAANLFICNADGSAPRQLSFNLFNDFNPSVLDDGRILYDRWEYNERSVTSLHKAFTTHPDGTHVAPLYGNATIKPNVIMFPRQVPGSRKIMALLTAHHGQTHGPIGLIDADRGVDGDGPLTVLTPDVPVSGEKVADSFAGWFSDPVPLSETTYLCSYTPTVQPWLSQTWALYVGDRHGNIALVYRDADISCAEPLPLVGRARPNVLPDTTDAPLNASSVPVSVRSVPVRASSARPSALGEREDRLTAGLQTPAPAAPGADASAVQAPQASLLMLDVYQGLGAVPPGTVKFLRILEDVPRKSVHSGGVIRTAAPSIYTVKRVLGTVPVEADGSAYFVVPADRNVYFEALDADQREVQRMRSVVCLKPSERRTCVGCHESRTTAPPNRRGLAWTRPPSQPDQPPWGGERILSYLRDVQPVINDKCVACHTYTQDGNRVVLTDDLTDQFSIGYEELVRRLSVANSMRWDHPDDVYARPPYTYGSRSSPLARLLDRGHYDVKLTSQEWGRLAAWIDANGVYYDRYENDRYPNRRIFAGQAGKAMADVYGRRCGTCHAQDNKGQHGTWWMSLNRRDPMQSRCLQAPLARSAGGWQRCGPAVFASCDDADYKALRAAVTSLADQLEQRPREDLLSIQGTPAWTQAVTLPPLPPPPPPSPAPIASPAVDGRSAVYLSDLAWLSASSGWTPNKDHLPRRDRNIESRPLRLGGRTYAKGIGTHAPSEIIYSIDGGYQRLTATVGGAEASGTVVFQVYGDGKLLFDSGTLRGLGAAKKLDVSVQGVRRLRLVVTDAGDGYYSDEANWADAILSRPPPATQPAKTQKP